MRNNDEIITKGLQFANRKKMSFHVTCATNGSCMDALLENVVRLFSIAIAPNAVLHKQHSYITTYS